MLFLNPLKRILIISLLSLRWFSPTPAIFLSNYLNTLFNALIIQMIMIIFLGIVTICLILSEYAFKKKTQQIIVDKKSFLLIKINQQKAMKINVLKVALISFLAGIITALTGMGGWVNYYADFIALMLFKHEASNPN
ncbi:hypothetical protein [Williamsoniiplasma luminosum]|uniref:Uncharacterized protein n=1 Tax=Williamsoniiplasma luminosum TaxID=214888 RepID=A0A2S0NJZ7_9MOLU|nr:hypothetical protein [Williamsoniiplasma luminosum]AVP49335.1 MAG: hypothetical protein C5T88_01935 [Williamsoniiplasma luminosum]